MTRIRPGAVEPKASITCTAIDGGQFAARSKKFLRSMHRESEQPMRLAFVFRRYSNRIRYLNRKLEIDMKYRWLTASVVTCMILGMKSLGLADDQAPSVPEGYRLAYSQDFAKPTAMQDFVMTDSSAWKLLPAKGQDKPSLALIKRKSNYTPPFRSPINIALVGGQVFGDCIIDVECLQTGKEYGHRDMIVVFGFQSPSQFYYTHIATKADDHANQIFIVDKTERKKISKTSNDGNNWGLGVWHHVRVERKASDGTIKVFFDDLTKPIMTAENKTLGPGWVGFGSFDDTGKVTDIKIWSPDAKAKQVPAFAK